MNPKELFIALLNLSVAKPDYGPTYTELFFYDIAFFKYELILEFNATLALDAEFYLVLFLAD
jgi:hypothetical protein